MRNRESTESVGADLGKVEHRAIASESLSNARFTGIFHCKAQSRISEPSLDRQPEFSQFLRRMARLVSFDDSVSSDASPVGCEGFAPVLLCHSRQVLQLLILVEPPSSLLKENDRQLGRTLALDVAITSTHVGLLSPMSQ